MSKKPRGTGGQNKARRPTDIDKWIGRLIRERRLTLKLRQDELAGALEITPHQLQKYETGINRITASRLVACAQLLKVHVSWFYQGRGNVPPIPSQLSEEEQALLERFRALSGASRKTLFDIALVLSMEYAATAISHTTASPSNLLANVVQTATRMLSPSKSRRAPSSTLAMSTAGDICT